MSHPTLVRRVLQDGGFTRAGAEVLVVRRDGRVEIRDVDAHGVVIRSATLERARVGKLVALFSQPAWATLAAERGAPIPDGPSYTITANHHSITRFDRPDDEWLARRSLALLQAIWIEVDP
jgi:hypothetical protein